MPKKKKILLIEDDQAQLAMYKLRLEMEGLTVATMERPEVDVVALIKKVKPDLVLLDLLIYDVDGIDILEKIRVNKNTAKTKVVILTNLVKANKMKRAKELGVLDVLIKAEMELDQLMAIIQCYFVA